MSSYWKDGDRRLISRYCKGDDQRLKSSYRRDDDQRLMYCYRKDDCHRAACTCLECGRSEGQPYVIEVDQLLLQTEANLN